MLCNAEEAPVANIANTPRSNPDVVVVAVAHVVAPASTETTSSLQSGIGLPSNRGETCSLASTTALSIVPLPQDGELATPLQAAAQMQHGPPDATGVDVGTAASRGMDLLTLARKKLPRFAVDYRAVLKRVALMGLSGFQDAAAYAHATIVGTVSTYNPYRVGKEEGGPQTASGEPYDPAAWTAAIKTNLRNRFGGVRYGKLYQPAFALVQSGAKQLIVKINDVGPLRPGRVLDLNERSMRHFDPFLTRGLLDDVRITLLPGEDWTAGPVGTAFAIDFASAEQRAMPAQFGSSDATALQPDAELARWRVSLAPVADGTFGRRIRSAAALIP
jgi:rare lipoprotein A